MSTPDYLVAAEARKAARPALVIIMGTSGCGKSTAGKQLSIRLGAPFVDGDDLHPKENVEKMSKGVPLTDEDRKPWIETIRYTATRVAAHEAFHHDRSSGQVRRSVVLIACSALKRKYRDMLRGKGSADEHTGVQTYFLYLEAPGRLLHERMAARLNHFMTLQMLTSQLATLEEPQPDEMDDTVTVHLVDPDTDLAKNPAQVADEAEQALLNLIGVPLAFAVTPSRPSTPAVKPLKSDACLAPVTELTDPSASPSSLLQALSLLLEPSQALEEYLVPDIRARLSQGGVPPVSTYGGLLDLGAAIVSDWPNEKKANFLGSHPRIGEVQGLSRFSAREQGGRTPTPSEVLARLEHLNAVYEKRYQLLRYVTFVNGRSRAEIADEMEGVLGDATQLGVDQVTAVPLGSAQWLEQLNKGIGEVWKIARSRLASLGAQ